MSSFMDPNDPHYSDTPDVSLHPLEGEKNVRPVDLTPEERSDPAQFIAIARRLHLAEHQCDGNCGQQMLRGDGVEGRLYALGVRVPTLDVDKPRPYIDMLDPADPPSPLLDFEYDEESRWLVENDGYGMSRIVAREVLPEFGRALVQQWAVLASSPAPAGLDETVDKDSYLAGWRDCYQHLRPAPAGLDGPYGGHPEFGPRVVANTANPSIAGWEALAKDALLAFDECRAALASSPAPAGLDEFGNPASVTGDDHAPYRCCEDHFPAPAGLDDALNKDGYLAGWRDCYQRLRPTVVDEHHVTTDDQLRAATRPAEDAGERS